MSDKKNYKDTLNLPDTDFPMRANLPDREPDWLADWQDQELYQTLVENRRDREPFILHFGPPFANGNLHVGHAITYLIKDFTTRSKWMAGNYAPLVVGWDCHGLPIEWKVERDLIDAGRKKEDIGRSELLTLCRREAEKWINVQKKTQKNWGMLADFDNPYLTMDPMNEAQIVRCLGQLAADGYIQKGYKTVNWSTVEETALAEAEIEYKQHTSTAIYTLFPVTGGGADDGNEYIAIWTTTPWTIPANRAVAYHDHIEYVPFELADGRRFWAAADLKDRILKDIEEEVVDTGDPVRGDHFAEYQLRHPFYDRQVPMVHGDHVSTEQGTGFVHTAPAHGEEDFQLGREYNLPLECPVGPDGAYLDLVNTDADGQSPDLSGLEIWDAEKVIISELDERKLLLAAYPYQHSYPVSWRSKAPLIFRTTPQWFIDVDHNDARQRALDEIERVDWIPDQSKSRIQSMVRERPAQWCISRQRAWGVPLTIFHDPERDEYLLDQDAFKSIAKKIEQHGVEAWETLSNEELLADYDYDGDVTALVKETDIVDVWIDSGTTWKHVMQARDDLTNAEQADLYMEGSDQHRGWFQSSLLTSVMLQNKAPYKQVATNGFVLGGDGYKMSKSLGNTVDPEDIIDQYGRDILRLWVGSVDFTEDPRLSDGIIKSVADTYRRIRNTLRFLLGNLSDFDLDQHGMDYADLPELEQWVLTRLYDEYAAAQDHYETYEFHQVVKRLHDFCATDLSSLYLDIRKDALYCDATDADRRRSIQTVLYHLFHFLVTHLAPILSFTMHEAWATYGYEDTVHKAEFYDVKTGFENAVIATKWNQIWDIRAQITKALESARADKDIGSSTDAHINVTLPSDLYEEFGDLDWAMLAITSTATVMGGQGDEIAVEVQSSEYNKCDRCWQRLPSVGQNPNHPDICERCVSVVQIERAAA